MSRSPRRDWLTRWSVGSAGTLPIGGTAPTLQVLAFSCRRPKLPAGSETQSIDRLWQLCEMATGLDDIHFKEKTGSKSTDDQNDANDTVDEPADGSSH